MKKNVSALYRLLFQSLILSVSGTCAAADMQELLQDTAFSRGFASYECEKAIPNGKKEEKYWIFQEGVHQNYTDEKGDTIKNLREHLLAVNHVIDKNSSESLVFSQYNNTGLLPGNARWNTRLIRRVDSDRRGMLKLYFNSLNEIRNAATSYGPKWANDTWPHFLIIQEFPKPYRVSQFKNMTMSFNLKISKANQLSTWPNGLPESSPSDITVLMYFLFSEQKRPDHKIWVGEILYSNINRKPHLSREQHGIAFYERMPKEWNNSYAKLGETDPHSVDAVALLREAIALFDGAGTNLSRDVDDYVLNHWNFGWEIIGHWESELVLSNLSLKGGSN